MFRGGVPPGCHGSHHGEALLIVGGHYFISSWRRRRVRLRGLRRGGWRDGRGCDLKGFALADFYLWSDDNWSCKTKGGRVGSLTGAALGGKTLPELVTVHPLGNPG